MFANVAAPFSEAENTVLGLEGALLVAKMPTIRTINH